MNENMAEPIGKWGHNLRILTQNGEKFYRIRYWEQMPEGAQSVIDFGAIGASASAAALTSTTKALQALLQLDDQHLYQLWMDVIDDVEVSVWVPGATPRWFQRNWSARATVYTPREQTEFFIIGPDRDAQFEVRNPRPTALARSRVRFGGYHYVLSPLDTEPAQAAWVPAQGWGA